MCGHVGGAQTLRVLTRDSSAIGGPAERHGRRFEARTPPLGGGAGSLLAALRPHHARLLDAAWDLINIEGTDASLARIAKAAGITRQSVYDHFGSRGGMIVAMVRRVDERLE
ncbi:MAG: helix-turn-helix domain containing protein [Candidatus Thiodiazotropha sp.]